MTQRDRGLGVERDEGMAAAGPWSVKGIDPKAREVAKDLARRSGMTLGEWLNQMIIEGELEPSMPFRDDPAEPGYRGGAARDFADRAFGPPGEPFRAPSPSKGGEMQRIARAVDQLTARIEAAEHRSTLAISGVDQSVRGVLARLEAVERDQGAVAARFDNALDDVRQAQAKAAEKMRRLADDEAPRLEAMKAFETALGKLAEKVYEGEGRTRSVLNELREDASNLSRRVDRAEAKVEAEPAALLVDSVVARLSDRLERAETRTADAVRGLEASFAGLDARLEAETERRFGTIASSLADQVSAVRAEMAERLKAASEGRLDRLEAALTDLSAQLAQNEQRSVQAVDRMGREVMRVASTLGERVARVEARSAETVQQMGGEMARIADAMEQRLSRQDAAQAQALEKLGGEIGRIAEKLAERIANAERRSTQSIEDVGEQLGRVTERLNQKHDRTQSELADRIQQSEARTAKLLEEANAAIEARLTEAQRRASLHAAQEAARKAAEAEVEGPDAGEVEPAMPSPFAAAPSIPPAFQPAFQPSGTEAPVFTHDPFAEPHTPPVAAEPAFDDPFAASPAPQTFAPAALAEPEPPRPPNATRAMLEQARAAVRQAADKAEPRGRRALGDAPPPGSVVAPPLESDGFKPFGLQLPKRKKKEVVTLRTAVVASGTAAALAMTTAGGVLLVNAEQGSAPAERTGTPHFGVAPTAVQADAPPQPAAPPAQMAVALTPPPGAAEGLKTPSAPSIPAIDASPAPAAADPAPAPSPAQPVAKTIYSAAVRRIESGDLGGVEDLKKAANLGHAPAQFYLAKLYETGGAGLSKDLVEARRWTERAAENGDASAMHNLGLYYYEGEAGPLDAAKAAQWFLKAASQGVTDSQFNLAMLYAKGYGVPQNPAEAYKWYLIAASGGDNGAKAAAQAIRGQLTPEAQSAAERSAAAFHAQSRGGSARTLTASR
jgi:localization factor PodJL